jgi:hypothetical protein
VASAAESACLLSSVRLDAAEARTVLERINSARTDHEVEMVEFSFLDAGTNPNLGLKYWLADQAAKGAAALGTLGAAMATAIGANDNSKSWLKDNIAWYGIASASIGVAGYSTGALLARRVAAIRQRLSRQEQLAKQIVMRLKADLEASGGKYAVASMEKRTLKYYDLHPGVLQLSRSGSGDSTDSGISVSTDAHNPNAITIRF